MSVLRLVNDLTGAQTYQEAWDGLTQAYESLTLQGAKPAASQAIALRNDLEGDFVARDADVYDVDCWTFGGCPPSADHALSADWRARLRRFARFLEQSALPGGEYVDPDAKPDLVDQVGAAAKEYGGRLQLGSLAILAIAAFVALR